MQTQCQEAANPKTSCTYLGCESTCTVQPSILTITIYYSCLLITFALAEDCYILVVFFVQRFFDICEPIFVVYSTIDMSCGVVQCLYLPPKNLRGKRNQFSPVCASRVDTLSHTIP